MKRFSVLAIVAAVALIQGCTRIESGEIGVRVNASKQVEGNELVSGSWNQTLIGDVLTFPIRDISMNVDNKNPLTSDNSALADFDMTIVYNINSTSVAELYTKKSKSFHYYDEKNNDTYLMFNYVGTISNNAAYKVVRQYKSLEVADNRQKIEAEIREAIGQQLKSESLENSIQITAVQVRQVTPNADILKSATEYVRAQNELRIKQTEVEIAKKEAERMQALSANGNQSIAFMEAQANLKIAEAIAAGKVNTIIVPRDFKGMVNVK